MSVPFDFSVDVLKSDRGAAHLLRTVMSAPVAIEEAFAFFCDAFNLERITPPELRFHIVTAPPIQMSVGTIIDYRLRLFGVPFKWRTKISLWEPPYRFVDEQVHGPYREWTHTHRLFEHADGSAIVDEVLYRLPFRPLGEIAAPLVGSQLRRIFFYRKQAIERILMRKEASA